MIQFIKTVSITVLIVDPVLPNYRRHSLPGNYACVVAEMPAVEPRGTHGKGFIDFSPKNLRVILSIKR